MTQSVGTVPMTAVDETVSNRMNQIATVPVFVSRHSRSAKPSALKSPVPMRTQLVGTVPNILVVFINAPSIPQIAMLPLGSRHTICAEAEAAKWPVATIDHDVGTVATNEPANAPSYN